YCVKSGDINDNQNTWLSLEYDIFGNDSISFWYKVSSEGSYDYLRFYIDGNELSSWSGDVAWQRIAFPVTAGTHIFKWQYDKDYSVSSGSDCAWVDFVVLPAPPMTTAYAGSDATICEGDNYQCEGAATLYNAIHWTTSGNGWFDDSQTLTPVYFPGSLDIENGSAILTLTAYNPDYNVSDNMTLTITGAPVALAGDDASVCADASYTLVNASAENYLSVEWITAGDGTFDDVNIINPVYTPGVADLAAGSVSLTFTVTGNEPCGSSTDEIVLTFIPAASAFAGENSETCSNDSLALSSATAANYASLLWSTSGDGTFNDNLLLNPVYTPGAADAENGLVTLTPTASGNGSCPAVNSETVITINPAASAFAGADAEIYSDETYVILDATAQNYSSLAWATSGDGTFSDAGVMNPAYTPGSNDIAAESVILTLTAVNEECGDISDDLTLAVNTNNISETRNDINLAIYPNPNSGNFILELNGNINEQISLKIVNAHGKEIYSSAGIKISNTYSGVIDLNTESGIYFIFIEGNGISITRKLVIN
ncbi:MAG: T9SS type A sorting domain-containing protein, partial [Bacteroidetes bacterium]|nr:T9SS type A sorting domain-containing protein [Bacteroidota bacterium]